jgi:hypothetical protein
VRNRTYGYGTVLHTLLLRSVSGNATNEVRAEGIHASSSSCWEVKIKLMRRGVLPNDPHRSRFRLTPSDKAAHCVTRRAEF